MYNLPEYHLDLPDDYPEWTKFKYDADAGFDVNVNIISKDGEIYYQDSNNWPGYVKNGQVNWSDDANTKDDMIFCEDIGQGIELISSFQEQVDQLVYDALWDANVFENPGLYHIKGIAHIIYLVEIGYDFDRYEGYMYYGDTLDVTPLYDDFYIENFQIVKL